MQYNRRKFIQVSSLASASLMVPGFLKSASNALVPGDKRKILVVIQLSGGNDGLNCVVPYRNDLYYKNRPGIGLDENQILTLNDEVALNSNLSGLVELFDDGKLAIINSVGYPNPNRSHFRSMDIWQSASDADKYITTGWVGRYLDANCTGSDCRPHVAAEIDDTLSLVLKGEQLKGIAFKNVDSLRIASSNSRLNAIGKNYQPDHADATYVEFLHKSLAETVQSADYIYEKSKIYKSKSEYPQHEFAKRMKMIAELIISGSETTVYYVSLPGFDTHVFQKGAHNRLLNVYGDTLRSFCNDLKENNIFNDTLILTFSEFGRRVKQNQSKGTDHGTANNVYIIGGALRRPGMYNAMSDLQNLDDGDLKYEIDFRRVYATVLDKWLKSDSESILKRKFESLGFV